MLRVLQINSVCGTGSTGRIASTLRTAIEERGGAGWVAFGRGDAAPPHALRIGSKLDVLVHGALTRIFDGHGLGSTAATNALVRRIERLAPDLVHLHNIHGYYLNFEVLFRYLRTADVPVLWTLHDCWAFTGHCSHFEYVGCDRWRTRCYGCPQKSEYPASWMLDRSAGMFERKRASFSGLRRAHIVTPSRWLADQVNRSFLGEYPVSVVPTGIDTVAFRPIASNDVRSRFGIPPDAEVVLGVAADFRQGRKGLEFLLRIASALPERVRVVLVGLHPSQLRSLPPHVIGIPRTNHIEELVALYSTADVFVNPTLEDTFPTVALESLSCGTPVITFATGGCAEQVTPDVGVVVPRGDHTALFDAVSIVLRQGRKSYSDACRRRGLKYSMPNMVRGYMEAYAAAGDPSRVPAL